MMKKLLFGLFVCLAYWLIMPEMGRGQTQSACDNIQITLTSNLSSSNNTSYCPGSPVTISVTVINNNTDSTFLANYSLKANENEIETISTQSTNATETTSFSFSQVIPTTTTTTYTVEVNGQMTVNGISNAQPCFLTQSITITVVDPTTVTANPNHICPGQQVMLSATGGIGYSWNTTPPQNGSSVTVSPTTTTTYTATINLGPDCSITKPVTVNVLPLPTAAITGTTAICSGQSATLTASGGASYSWSNGGSGASITVSPTATTNYTVTVTNASGCSNTANSTVTVNPLPTTAIAVSETSGIANNDGSICNGASATLTASGGTSYAWSTGATGASITVFPTATTTYTVTVTNANGCSNTNSRTITVNPLPTVSITPVNPTICAGQNVTLTASGGGTAYNWSNGQFGQSVTLNPTSTTTFIVTVTNSFGCTATASSTVTVNPPPTPSVSVNETSGNANNDGIICAGAQVTLSASGGVAYQWSNGETTAGITVSPSTTTTYTVTVTNANGCGNTNSRTITVNPLPAITTTSTPNTTCAMPYTGVASVTSPVGAGFSYLWSTGANTQSITQINGGNYTVTVTNTGTGCSHTASVTVPNSTPSPTITATGANPTTCGGSNGSITIGGLTAGTTYVVHYSKNSVPQSPQNLTASAIGQVVVSGLTSGNYSNIYVIPPNNCQSNQIDGIVLNNPASPSVTAGSNSPVCVGANITLTATPSGGSGVYTGYAWSGPNGYTNSQQNPPLFAATSSSGGAYQVTVTDNNGCTGSNSVVVTVNSAPTSPTISVSETSGNTPNDGTICNGASATLTATATGGGTFQWSNGQSGASITVSPATTTTYTVTLTQNGCTATATRTITVENCGTPCANPAVVTLSPPTAVSVCGAVAQTFSFTLSGGATSASITENGAGSVSPNNITSAGAHTITYTPTAADIGNPVTITITTNDPDGAAPNCSAATATAQLTVNPIPVVSPINGNSNICLGTPQTFTATPTGGTWATANPAVATVNPATGQVSGVSPGSTTITYTVTQNGCTGSSSIAVNVSDCACPNPATVSVTPGSASVCGTTPQTFSITLGGGATSATITENGAGSVSPTTVTGAGAHTITYTPASGDTGNTVTITINTNDPDGTGNLCSSAQQQVTLTVNPLPSVPIISGPDAVCVGATITLSNATGGGTWISNNTAVATINTSSGVVTGVSAGAATITYTVTNTQGCSASVTKSINVHALPTVAAITGNLGVCLGATTPLQNATPGGTWSSSNPDIPISSGGVVSGNALGQTTITYTVNNATTGCTNSVSAVVTVNALPTANAGLDQTICAGGSATLTASGGTSYSWSNGGSGASITVSPAVTTTYTVTVTNAQGCTASDNVAVTVISLPTASISGSTAICSGQSAALTLAGTPNGTVTYQVNGAGSQTITLSASGTATLNTGPLTATTTYSLQSVTLPGTAPCTASVSGQTTVTVNALPNVAIDGNTTICAGDSTTLTASGGTSYAWGNGLGNNQFITVSPIATTTYTVTVTNADGCSAVGSKEVVVNALPVPSISVQETSGVFNNDGIICAGASTTLTASGGGTGGTYTWSNGNNGANITVLPVTTTPYTVTVTNAAGCTASANKTVIVNPLPTMPSSDSLLDTTAILTTGLVDVNRETGFSYTLLSGSTILSLPIPLSTFSQYNSVTLKITDTATGCSSEATYTNVLGTCTPSIYEHRAPSATLPAVLVCTIADADAYQWGYLNPTNNTFFGVITGLPDSLTQKQVLVIPQNLVQGKTIAVIVHKDDCWSIATYKYEADPGTPAQATEIRIQPNPSRGSFDLWLQADYEGEVYISISDMAGRVLYRQTAQKTSGAMALGIQAPLPVGMYLLQATFGTEQKVLKLLLH